MLTELLFFLGFVALVLLIIGVFASAVLYTMVVGLVEGTTDAVKGAAKGAKAVKQKNDEMSNQEKQELHESIGKFLSTGEKFFNNAADVAREVESSKQDKKTASSLTSANNGDTVSGSSSSSSKAVEELLSSINEKSSYSGSSESTTSRSSSSSDDVLGDVSIQEGTVQSEDDLTGDLEEIEREFKQQSAPESGGKTKKDEGDGGGWL